MRDIKFRIYAVTSPNMPMAMRFYDLKSLKSMSLDIVNNPSSPIMQYTGLKDKFGKEIYEGDIVENDFGKGSYISGKVSGTVIWNKEEAKFDIDSGLLDECLFRGNIEVVGNIYENKELLK